MSEQPHYYIDKECQTENAVVEFVRNAMPDAWWSCARELRDSAEILWSDRNNTLRVEVSMRREVQHGELRVRKYRKRIYSMSRPYVLLAGFALENLMKGHLIASDPSLINAGRLTPALKSHSLTSLAVKVKGLTLSKEERRFCEVAESAIPYWGRYPIPLVFTDVVPEVSLNARLRQGFLSLFDRLDKDLYMMIRNGWDSGVGAKSWEIHDAK